MTALKVIAGVGAILAMYVLMFAAVYLWSRYAPIFPPNGTGLAMVRAISQSTG